MATRGEIIAWAGALHEDLNFSAAREWLAEKPGRKAGGYLPVYAPRELLRACGLLPVGVHGGGDRLEIIRGDACYQSYICHLPRSVVELAQSGRLDFLSAMLFPSTCDVIRNLSGVWQLQFPGVYVKYLDLPQIAEPALAADFWELELKTLLRELGEVGHPADEARLNAAFTLYNDHRQAVRDLYAARRDRPWQFSSEELCLLLRAGEVVPAEEFIARAREFLAVTEAAPGRVRDRCRVIVVGAFCEQPPLGLIKTLERAGCFIVDDDFLLGNRFIEGDVVPGANPLRALAEATARRATASSILYERDPEGKRLLMKRRVEAARADGIIFAAPSFCDPALLDRPMLRAGAEAFGIPSIAFQYAENSGQFQQFREQAGTFADALKLWGGAA